MIENKANQTVTLTFAEYNKLIDRLNNAYKTLRDCDALFKALQKTAGAGSTMIDASLKGVGDPNPPVDLSKVPSNPN